MKSITLLFYFSLVTLLFLSACVEETDWEYQPEENGQLVVESILTNETIIQSVQLSNSFDDINGTPSPVSNAKVILSNGQNEFTFLESSSVPGKYISSQAIAAQMNSSYFLQIESNDQLYTAQSQMVHILPYSPITIDTIGESNFRRLSNIPNLYSTIEQAMFIVDIDWSHLTDSLPNQAKQVFYTFTSIDVNEIFRPNQTEVKFPRGSIVITKKYSLNNEFANYLRALVMETEWQGGILDENSASLPTNIDNGAIGFFSVCSVLSDTIIAQ